MTVSYWRKTTPSPRKAHLCASVHFTQPIEDSPISCECGWSGLLIEWAGHAPPLTQVAWGTPSYYGLPALREDFLPKTRSMI